MIKLKNTTLKSLINEHACLSVILSCNPSCPIIKDFKVIKIQRLSYSVLVVKIDGIGICMHCKQKAVQYPTHTEQIPINLDRQGQSPEWNHRHPLPHLLQTRHLWHCPHSSH